MSGRKHLKRSLGTRYMRRLEFPRGKMRITQVRAQSRALRSWAEYIIYNIHHILSKEPGNQRASVGYRYVGGRSVTGDLEGCCCLHNTPLSC